MKHLSKLVPTIVVLTRIIGHTGALPLDSSSGETSVQCIGEYEAYDEVDLRKRDADPLLNIPRVITSFGDSEDGGNQGSQDIQENQLVKRAEPWFKKGITKGINKVKKLIPFTDCRTTQRPGDLQGTGQAPSIQRQRIEEETLPNFVPVRTEPQESQNVQQGAPVDRIPIQIVQEAPVGGNAQPNGGQQGGVNQPIENPNTQNIIQPNPPNQGTGEQGGNLVPSVNQNDRDLDSDEEQRAVLFEPINVSQRLEFSQGQRNQQQESGEQIVPENNEPSQEREFEEQPADRTSVNSAENSGTGSNANAENNGRPSLQQSVADFYPRNAFRSNNANNNMASSITSSELHNSGEYQRGDFRGEEEEKEEDLGERIRDPNDPGVRFAETALLERPEGSGYNLIQDNQIRMAQEKRERDFLQEERRRRRLAERQGKKYTPQSFPASSNRGVASGSALRAEPRFRDYQPRTPEQIEPYGLWIPTAKDYTADKNKDTGGSYTNPETGRNTKYPLGLYSKFLPPINVGKPADIQVPTELQRLADRYQGRTFTQHRNELADLLEDSPERDQGQSGNSGSQNQNARVEQIPARTGQNSGNQNENDREEQIPVRTSQNTENQSQAQRDEQIPIPNNGNQDLNQNQNPDLEQIPLTTSQNTGSQSQNVPEEQIPAQNSQNIGNQNQNQNPQVEQIPIQAAQNTGSNVSNQQQQNQGGQPRVEEPRPDASATNANLQSQQSTGSQGSQGSDPEQNSFGSYYQANINSLRASRMGGNPLLNLPNVQSSNSQGTGASNRQEDDIIYDGGIAPLSADRSRTNNNAPQ